MKTIKLIAMMTLLVSTANAKDFNRNSCIKERRTLLSSESVATKCEVVRPLKLKTMEKDYPLMNIGELKVRYWEGQFLKAYKTIEKYEHSYINVCSGVKTFSEVETYHSESYDHFNIYNPNLSDEIDQSFETAPMTEAEAKVSMIELEKSCNK